MKTTILIVVFGCLMAASNGQGIDCTANCASCLNGVCLRCVPPFSWNGIQCSRQCPFRSWPNNGICLCQNNLLLYAGSCVPDCPLGMLNYTKICVPCQAPCKTCSQRIDSCDSCIDGYTWDSLAKTCIASANCPLGQTFSGSSCNYICQPNYYFLNSACFINSCPADYIIDDSRRICGRS